ncbi:MAG TPA: HAD-IA family hydrolase [Solirubrobacteraceae bacterium]|nr:HAD-IA family hydrolase [Solirubrobacteraceae bacterium]
MTVVLSDLDGVLVDSRASIMRAWRWWAARRGLGDGTADAVPQGRPSGDVIASLAPGADVAAESRAIDRFQAADTDGVVALPGAADLLAAFGPDRVAIVTSCTAPLAAARLRAAGLAAPPVLVTAELLTRGKPDPEGYLLAARRLGAEPAQCVVLEDAPAGVEAGLAAGMHVVGVLTTHAPRELAGAHERVASVADWLRAGTRR